jgi:hypothetical protein
MCDGQSAPAHDADPLRGVQVCKLDQKSFELPYISSGHAEDEVEWPSHRHSGKDKDRPPHNRAVRALVVCK